MKTVGYWFFIGGAILAAIAFFLPTSIDSSSSTSVMSGTLNLGLLQNQMMILHVGLAGFLGGAILIGCGEIAERLGTAPGEPKANTDLGTPAAGGNTQAPVPLDGSIADGIAIKIVFGVIVAVLFILLFIYLGNRAPASSAVSTSDVNQTVANLTAEADRVSAEANAISPP